MEGNKFRELIKSGKYAMGLVITIPDPTMVELAAYAGYGFLIIHGEERIGEMVRAAEAAQIPVLVGMGVLGGNVDAAFVTKALDLGADGINFMLVETKEQAEHFVKICKPHPIGQREVMPGSRLAKYWGMPLEEYIRRANDVVVSIKIETKEGLEHAEEILSVPGIDMVSVGRSDMARSLGLKGREDPRIDEVEQHIMRIAKSNGVALLKGAMTPDIVGDWVKREDALRLFFTATDGTQIGRAYRELIHKCNDLVVKNAKGEVELASRVSESPTPWLTTQSPGDKR